MPTLLPFDQQVAETSLAGAVKLAEPYIDEDLLIIFVDTLFDADLSLVKSLPEEEAGVIWAKEVEDYQRFGVIVTAEDGTMTRIVEKPSEPVSKLANIGLYYIRDWKLLFDGNSTAGWRNYQKESIGEGWRVVDGARPARRGAPQV